MLNRTLSQMCGRWYLPMSLLRDGLLTLIYKAYLMVLIRFWSSLPAMLKLSIVTVWPEVLKWSYVGEGAFRCSLNLSANVLDDSPIYSSSHSTLSHFYLYMTPLFIRIWSLSFGAIRRFLMESPPLKYICTPCLPHAFLMLSLQNLMRTIKEALYIRVNNPSLNRDIGKYHQPHIWDKVLFNITELKLK